MTGHSLLGYFFVLKLINVELRSLCDGPVDLLMKTFYDKELIL